MTKTLMERQLELEQAAVDYSYDRLQKQIARMIKDNKADDLLEGRLILLHSIDAVAAKLGEYFNTRLYGIAANTQRVLSSEFSEDTKSLAYVVIATMVRVLSKQPLTPTTTVISAVNTAVRDSIVIRRLDNKGDTLSAYVDTRFSKRSLEFRNREKMKIAQRQKSLGYSELTAETAGVGAVLIDAVIKSGVNLFENKMVWDKKKKRNYITFTAECYQMVLKSREDLLQEYQKFPILLVEPKKWTGFSGSGGYYSDHLYKVDAIKARYSSRKLLKAYFKETDQTKLFDTLNTLQATPWRINQRVFDVAYEIFNNNIEDPTAPRNNPRLVGKLPYKGFINPDDYVNPADFGELHTEGPHKGKFKEMRAKREYHKALEDQRDICTASNGRSLAFGLAMNVAMEYIKEPEFYFSYNYDFRGRIYPLQQHLNTQGTGAAKALLEFANGSPIDSDDAYRWFMINGGNYYGYDKLPYDQRVSKMEEMKDDILAIADDPMKNRNIWGGADEPFLWLAWCFEYSDYLKDRDGFLSHLPVALDATCSGIQIYSGLLRDKEGAKAVNVIGDTREDIYQRVADKVNDYLEKGEYQKTYSYTDSAGAEKTVDTEAVARSLKGKVTRALVKQNVMTTPYSVTYQGMKDQVVSVLKDLENDNNRFWVGDTWLVASFLAGLNQRAISETVEGATIGQEYLKDLTRHAVKKNKYIFYTAPLTGFPMLQKVHAEKVERITTPIGKLSLSVKLPRLDSIGMQNGIAPNFVHSLDSALLAETITRLHTDGCNDFHVIHDSYAVPANQVANLNKHVRETFVDLFSLDPLKMFYDQAGFDYEITPEEVILGDLCLEDVLKSEYIFS